MAWGDYVSGLVEEYKAVLSADPTEADTQRFFECNPALVPGAFPNGIGHGAFPEALISQPALSGVGTRRPDFMWLARNSAMVQPVLIEIESPQKRWLAGRRPRDLRPSADLTHALNQLRQWEQWLEKPANQDVLLESYGVPTDLAQAPHTTSTILADLRASDGESRGDRETAQLLQPRGFNVHAYDNLHRPNEWCKDYITVRSRGDGTYTAVHIPPTVSWIASSPESWRVVSGAAPRLCWRLQRSRTSERRSSSNRSPSGTPGRRTGWTDQRIRIRSDGKALCVPPKPCAAGHPVPARLAPSGAVDHRRS